MVNLVSSSGDILQKTFNFEVSRDKINENTSQHIMCEVHREFGGVTQIAFAGKCSLYEFNPHKTGIMDVFAQKLLGSRNFYASPYTSEETDPESALQRVLMTTQGKANSQVILPLSHADAKSIAWESRFTTKDRDIVEQFASYLQKINL